MNKTKTVSGGINLSRNWIDNHNSGTGTALLFFLQNCTKVSIISSSSISAILYLVSGFGENNSKLNKYDSPYRCIKPSNILYDDEGEPVTSIIIKIGINKWYVGNNQVDYVEVNLPKGRKDLSFELEDYNNVREEAMTQNDIYYKTCFPSQNINDEDSIDLEPSCPGIINWASNINADGKFANELYNCLIKNLTPRKNVFGNLTSNEGNIDDNDVTNAIFNKNLQNSIFSQSKVFWRNPSIENKPKHTIWFIAMELADGYRVLKDYIQPANLDMKIKYENEHIFNKCMYEYVKMQRRSGYHHNDAHWGNFMYNPNINHYGVKANDSNDFNGRALVIDFGRLKDIPQNQLNYIRQENYGEYAVAPDSWYRLLYYNKDIRLPLRNYPGQPSLQQLYKNPYWGQNITNNSDWFIYFNIREFESVVKRKKEIWMNNFIRNKGVNGKKELLKLVNRLAQEYKNVNIQNNLNDSRKLPRVEKLNRAISKLQSDRKKLEEKLKIEEKKKKYISDRENSIIENLNKISGNFIAKNTDFLFIDSVKSSIDKFTYINSSKDGENNTIYYFSKDKEYNFYEFRNGILKLDILYGTDKYKNTDTSIFKTNTSGALYLEEKDFNNLKDARLNRLIYLYQMDWLKYKNENPNAEKEEFLNTKISDIYDNIKKFEKIFEINHDYKNKYEELYNYLNNKEDITNLKAINNLISNTDFLFEESKDINISRLLKTSGNGGICSVFQEWSQMDILKNIEYVLNNLKKSKEGKDLITHLLTSIKEDYDKKFQEFDILKNEMLKDKNNAFNKLFNLSNCLLNYTISSEFTSPYEELYSNLEINMSNKYYYLINTFSIIIERMEFYKDNCTNPMYTKVTNTYKKTRHSNRSRSSNKTKKKSYR